MSDTKFSGNSICAVVAPRCSGQDSHSLDIGERTGGVVRMGAKRNLPVTVGIEPSCGPWHRISLACMEGMLDVPTHTPWWIAVSGDE